MGKLTISMAIFNSYFDITRGYDLGNRAIFWSHLRFKAWSEFRRLLGCDLPALLRKLARLGWGNTGLGWGERWEKMIQIFSEEITLGKVFGGKNAVRCEEFRGTSDDLHVLKWNYRRFFFERYDFEIFWSWQFHACFESAFKSWDGSTFIGYPLVN